MNIIDQTQAQPHDLREGILREAGSLKLHLCGFPIHPAGYCQDIAFTSKCNCSKCFVSNEGL